MTASDNLIDAVFFQFLCIFDLDQFLDVSAFDNDEIDLPSLNYY